MTDPTNIKLANIIAYIQRNLNRGQLTGLNSLIFLALREQTTVAYQRKEWAFEDIPEQIIGWCDGLAESDILELASEVAIGLLDEITAAQIATENGKS